MSNESVEIAGIDQAADPCWYPATPDGLAFEWGDGCPHWQSEDEGRERIVAIRNESDADLSLHRETEGCWHVACAECGYRYDEDEWVSHFPSRADAVSAADDCDWHVLDDRLLCPDCYLAGDA